MDYEAWRISYQSSEQAARAAFAECQRLEAVRDRLESHNNHLRYALKMAYTALDKLGDEPDCHVSAEAWQRTTAEAAVSTARNVLGLTGDYPAG